MPPLPDEAAFSAAACDAASFLRHLANEHRLLLLCRLGACEVSVGQLAHAVGLTQPAVSQHLARLRAAGIVATRRDATTIWYRIEDARVVRLIGTLGELFCPNREGLAVGAAPTCAAPPIELASAETAAPHADHGRA